MLSTEFEFYTKPALPDRNRSELIGFKPIQSTNYIYKTKKSRDEDNVPSGLGANTT